MTTTINLSNINSIEINKIIKMYKSLFNYEDNNNIELELRIGDKVNDNFNPTITKDMFNRLKLYFNKDNSKFIGTTIETKYYNKDKNIKIIEHSPDGRKHRSEYYINKEKVYSVDIDDYNFRMCLSNETSINKNDFNENEILYIKTRTRYEYIYKDMYIHISEFRINNSNIEQYDCEIEMINPNFTDKMRILEVYEDIAKIMNNYNYLLSNTVKDTILEEYYKCVNTQKFIGKQPHTIKINKIDQQEQYALTYKLDGERRLLFINSEGNGYYISNKMNIEKTKFTFYNKFAGTIFDGELYNNKFYIFDLLYFKNDIVDNVDLSIRIHAIKEILDIGNNENLYMKPYIFTEDLCNEMSNMINNIDLKQYDGIILMPVKSIKSTILKWKPVEMNTIDFKVKFINNIPELYVYNKFNEVRFDYKNANIKILGIIKNPEYIKILKHDTVYEMTYNVETNEYIPIRERKDKIKGNFVKVAIDNMESILYPFNVELLKRSHDQFFNMKRYHNWIKRNFINEFCSNKTLIDLSCGRGGDIQKWIDYGVRYVEGYDINITSITEAKLRCEKALSIPNFKNYNFEFIELDLNNNEINDGPKVNSMSNFFAIHYFVDNLNNFLKNTVNKRLMKDGYFLCTMIDLEKAKKINKINDSKFKLEFKDSHTISIYINDTIVSEEREEVLIEKNKFISQMKENDLELVKEVSFEDMYQEWFSKKNFLDEVEQQLSFIHTFYVFKKIS